jgi:hypothetical protein
MSRPQFQIRTLLVAVALIALILGASRASRDQSKRAGFVTRLVNNRTRHLCRPSQPVDLDYYLAALIAALGISRFRCRAREQKGRHSGIALSEEQKGRHSGMAPSEGATR